MATLKTIRKRISSVKNTQKITRAMKMVAAAKLRRAQQALVGARPYAEQLEASLGRWLVSLTDFKHPLLQAGDLASIQPKKAQVLVLTSDRGLCGGFNGNLLRQVEIFLREQGKDLKEINIATIGRKGRDYYRAKKRELSSTESLGADFFTFGDAQKLTGRWIEAFQNQEFEILYLAFNHFKSAISQVPTIRPVLPLSIDSLSPGGRGLGRGGLKLAEEGAENIGAPIAWEEDPQLMIQNLLSRYVANQFYIAVLESQASELGARMSAMENATNNANDMIGSLTLQYNRARQAAITTELMDIVNGAEALG